jgi:hypothetical protein
VTRGIADAAVPHHPSHENIRSTRPHCRPREVCALPAGKDAHRSVQTRRSQQACEVTSTYETPMQSDRVVLAPLAQAAGPLKHVLRRSDHPDDEGVQQLCMPADRFAVMSIHGVLVLERRRTLDIVREVCTLLLLVRAVLLLTATAIGPQSRAVRPHDRCISAVPSNAAMPGPRILLALPYFNVYFSDIDASSASRAPPDPHSRCRCSCLLLRANWSHGFRKPLQGSVLQRCAVRCCRLWLQQTQRRQTLRRRSCFSHCALRIRSSIQAAAG